MDLRALAARVPVRALVTVVALAGVLAGAWAVRMEEAGTPRKALSADERAYVRIAEDLQRAGTYGDPELREPFHWAPGAPALFALAASDDRADLRDTSRGPGPLRTAQVVVSTLTVLLVAGLGWLVAGPIAGLAAGAIMAFYPPAAAMTAGFLSEPLGGCLLALAGLALAWAWRGGGEGRFALAGMALGLACLARADTLPAAVILPAAVVALLWRRERPSGALWRGGLLAAGVAAVLAPWVAHASTQAGHLVPVTDGGSSAFFIATSLEGGGTLYGVKRALHPEACRIRPAICHRSPIAVRAEYLLDAVAARHPGLSRDAALRREAFANLAEARRRPGAYAEMQARKVVRLWGGYFRGRNVPADPAVLWGHRVLVLAALAGVLAGIARARSGVLAALLLALLACSALNVLFVAEPRHNARMVPVLVAAGAAGWVLAVRGRPRPEPAGAVAT